MTAYDNGLNDAGLERLAILMEECGEVVQSVGKILRHGYENEWLTSHQLPSNRASLAVEIGQVLAAVDMMIYANDIDPVVIKRAQETRAACLEPYLHYQKGDLS